MLKNKPKFQDESTRINHHIRALNVRVIANNGTPLGIMSAAEALEKAIAAGYDLVEVSPKADPPVCKIMDYGKFKYEKAKKEKEAKKKQHIMHLKEIKFHPQTEEHDLNFKLDHARKFLLKGDRVKMTVVFRGREIAYKDFGRQLLEKIDVALADIAASEILYKLEGKNMISAYVPDKNKIQIYKRKLEKEQRDAELNQIRENEREMDDSSAENDETHTSNDSENSVVSTDENS